MQTLASESSVSTAAGASTTPSAEHAPRSALHLPYLDGLRACAALYVVLFHSVCGFSDARLGGVWHVVRRAFTFGHEAVAIFIVLSGYCLMLPVVRKEPARPATQFRPFLRRRALRILPPYAAALVLSLGLIALVPALRVSDTGTIWDNSLPGLTAGAVISHVLLVHNWSPEWVFQINGPLWSVATEWQIYFLFPLLLLPVWRRAGMLGALAASAVVGCVPLLLAPAGAAQASPWYLILFTFGMIGAALGFGDERMRALGAALPWGRVSAAAWGVCALLITLVPKFWFHHKPISDVLLGAATATLLVHLTARTRAAGRERGRLLPLLEGRWAVGLGRCSYSLYLTHLPLIALCASWLRPLGWRPVPAAALLVVVSTPFCLAFAYVFYLCVERPFLVRRGLAQSAVLDPAIAQ